MAWVVRFHPDFDPEFDLLAATVADSLVAHLGVLAEFGPKLGRPLVDTLKGSAYANMKELRFKADGGVWRFAFAFDPERAAIVLCGGNKQGQKEPRFYRALITLADKRFASYLTTRSSPDADPH